MAVSAKAIVQTFTGWLSLETTGQLYLTIPEWIRSNSTSILSVNLVLAGTGVKEGKETSWYGSKAYFFSLSASTSDMISAINIVVMTSTGISQFSALCGIPFALISSTTVQKLTASVAFFRQS